MIKKLWSFFGSYKKYVGLGIGSVVLDVVCELMIPTLSGLVMDRGIQNSDMPYIVKIGIVMITIAVVAVITGGANSYFTSKSSQGMASNIRKSLFGKVQDFSAANTDEFSPTSLITRLTSDVNNVQNATMMSLRLLVRAPLMMILSVFMAARINKKLTLIMLLVVPILLILIFIIFKLVSPLFLIIQEKLDVLNRVIQENIMGQRVVKAFVRQKHEEEKFEKSNEDLVAKTVRGLSIISLLSPIVMLIMNGTSIAAIWLGSEQVGLGNMGVGQLNSFLSYTMQIMFSFVMMSMVFIMVARAMASAKRIFEVVETEPEIQNKQGEKALAVRNGDIEFKDVNFAYPLDGSGETLRNINLKIPQGKFYAIVGSTGEGKSTLVNLIPRLYDVNKGKVLVGGHDVRDYELDVLRTSVGVVLQKNVLFSGTIKENIRWGNPSATDDEIIRVSKAAQAHDFIMDFPDGYDTWIEQGGTNVSGGQRQRLCISRALIKDPKILILDDSTSALDTATESKIQNTFKKELKDTTIVMIAQRISSVDNADCIVVMNDGEISDIGTHDELLETSKIYKEIYDSQKEEEA